MEDFIYQNATRIIFGKDTVKALAGQLKDAGVKKALLHYGSDRIKEAGLYDEVLTQLKDAGVAFVELSGVVPNPRLSLVREGVELCREEGVDIVLAVGGGSVIDSAKAIAAGARYAGDVWDLFEGKAPVREALMVATVLTIPAAGSESSPASVVTDEENGRKVGLLSDRLRPVFSILDPSLTVTLPDYQTACGVADMLAHVMERYFVSVSHVDVTDRLCEAHMRSIVKNARLVLANPQDYDYRAEVMLAGMIAHNDWLNVGRTRGDWASHAIEHELSAAYDIAHGAGLAIVFPAWMRHVYKEDAARFALWAREVWGVSSHDDDEAALLGISSLESFFREIGLPVRMSEAGIGGDRIVEMASLAVKGGLLGQFKSLGEDDVKAIYDLAR